MNTEPILNLFRRYDGDLLKATPKELVEAFREADGDFEILIEKAREEYKEKEERERVKKYLGQT